MDMKKRKRNMTWFEFKLTAREYRIRAKEWLFKLWLDLQTVTFSTNFSVRPLERIPRGENPLYHDAYHLATSLGKNVMIMHRNFPSDPAEYLILCHIPSGERYILQFPKDSAVADEKPVRTPRDIWEEYAVADAAYLALNYPEAPVHEDAGLRL